MLAKLLEHSDTFDHFLRAPPLSVTIVPCSRHVVAMYFQKTIWIRLEKRDQALFSLFHRRWPFSIRCLNVCFEAKSPKKEEEEEDAGPELMFRVDAEIVGL